MAKQPLKECATCGKSWKKRTVEDGTLCPYCGSNAVRDARMTDAATGARGGGGCCGVVVMLLVLLLAGGAAAYYWWANLYQPSPPPPTPAPAAQPAEEPPPVEPEPAPVIDAPVEPPAEEPAAETPAPPPAPPSRDWFELAENYRRAGRNDLAARELRKIIDAGDPEWVEKAQAMLDEIGE